MYTTLCTLAAAGPAATMIAAHYIPWRKSLGRDLHRLEAYALGTAAIIGGAVGTLSLADDAKQPLSPRQAAGIMIASATGAGVATLAAWAFDAVIERRHQRLDRELRNASQRRQ